MTATYDYDGTPLARVRRGSVELTQSAENLQVGSGRLTYDDTPGTLAIIGQMDFAADEDACSNPITARGFIGPRSYSRQSERKAAAREIDIEFQDLNAMAGFRRLRATGSLTAAEAGKRPAETVAERGAWLMASPFVVGLFSDEGRCDFPATKGMDKADYRNQFPGDVLADMVLASLGYNAYIRDFGDGPELVFRNDNVSTADTTDLRVSNVISDVTGDIDDLTFYPMKDAVLRRDPSQVISDIGYQYAKGTVNEERAATATAFNGERGGTASNSNVKGSAKATDEAREVLWQRHTEEDTIECTIQVPAESVNLVNQGDRISARFSHLTPEGYGSFSWFRVLECTKKPLLKPANLYDVRLKLSPQEAAPVVGAIVQEVHQFTGTGGSGFPPYTHLANPPSIGNSLLVAISMRSGHAGQHAYPAAPNTDSDRPRWGAGAWTDLAFDIGAFTETYVEDVAGNDARHGIAFYWKVVDATTQDCAILNDYQNVSVWEVSGVDFSAATLQRANNQTANTTFDVGTLGTIAVGELGFMIIHTAGPHDAPPHMPAVTPSAGWTQDYYHQNYPWWAGITYPIVWTGHAIGDGSTVNPAITRAAPTRRWCGLAIKVGP